MNNEKYLTQSINAQQMLAELMNTAKNATNQ